jgi:hypothetical protein
MDYRGGKKEPFLTHENSVTTSQMLKSHFATCLQCRFLQLLLPQILKITQI